jgi:zinc protease
MPSEPPRIERTEVDGIPTFWAEAPGPLVASLSFRIGTADESLPYAGLTHLVEHLVLADFGEHTYDVNGTVDDTRTVFIINGSPPEVVDFLNRVAERLVSPPVERLELERDVLRSEYMQRPSTSQDGLRMARFGPRDYGLLPAEPIGLDWLGADDVIGWTRRSFVRQRAALWLSGPPPAGLSLSLPDGTWSAPPIPVAHAAAQLPMHVVGLPDGLVVGAMGKRSVGLNIGWQLAERALRRRLRHTEGVLYDIAGSYSPLTADIADMALGGECRGDRVGYVRDAIIEELTRLERDGPTTAEIETQVTLFRRQFEEPFAPLGVLDTIVTNLLFGRPYESPAEMLAEYSGAQPNDVAAAFADGVIASLVVIAPEDVPLAPGFQLDAASSSDTIKGAEFRPAGGILRRPRGRLVVGDAGIMAELPDDRRVTIRYDNAAVVRHVDDDTRELYGLDGFRAWIHAADWRDGKRAIALIDQATPLALVACVDHGRSQIDTDWRDS